MNDKNMKKFELELTNLINNCNLTVGEAYYVLKSAYMELEHLFLQILAKPTETTVEEEHFDMVEEEPKGE